MADRNQLKVRYQSDIDETDPLAELTRIMGFDPRHEPAPPADDDLGIDLERELMGEFGSGGSSLGDEPSVEASFAEPARQAPQVDDAAALTPETVELDENFDATFEEMFATNPMRDPEPISGEHQVETLSQQPSDFASAEDDVLNELDSAFDEAIAASVADEWQPSDEFTASEADLGVPVEEPASRTSEEGAANAAEAEGDGFTGHLSPAEDALGEAAFDTEQPDIDIDFTGQLSPVEDAAHRQPEDVAADDDVDVDFTGQLSPAEDALDEAELDTEQPDIDIDFIGQLSPVEETAYQQPEDVAADDAVDVDFTGQLSPVGGAPDEPDVGVDAAGLDIDFTGQLSPVEETAYQQPEDVAADDAVDVDFTGQLSPIEGALDEAELDTELPDVDIDFTGQLSPVEETAHHQPEDVAVDEVEAVDSTSRLSFMEDGYHEPDASAEEAEVDIDFTGQLSPVEEAELAADSELAPTESEVPDEQLSLEDELSALLGASHPVTASVASATPALNEATADYETPTDIEDRYEGQREVAASSWEPAVSQMSEPESSEAAQPYVETASEADEGQAEEMRAAAGDSGFRDAKVGDEDIEFDFEFDPEGTFVPQAGEISEEGLVPASHDLPVEEAMADAASKQVAAFDVDPAEELDELVLDESEFEAALADEFSDAASMMESAREQETAEAGELASALPEVDPFENLATMGFEPLPQNALQPSVQLQSEDSSDDSDANDSRAREAPEIDTVEVSEAAVALADDLDIPDVAFEDEPARSVAFDDFESDFSQAFEQPAPAQASSVSGDSRPAGKADEFDTDFNRIFEDGNFGDELAGHAGAAAVGATAGAYAGAPYAATAPYAQARPSVAAGDQFHAAEYATDDESLGYDPEMDGDVAVPNADGDAKPSRKRGLFVAALVAGVAVAGGVGAFVMSLGDGNDTPPVLVKAEPGPVKIKPENPGGVVVPNQDNKVYERVAGEPVAAPSQETLISSTEEPVEIPATPTQPLVTQPAEAEAESELAKALPGVDLQVPEAEPATSGNKPSGKAEDRIDPSQLAGEVADNEAIAVVEPRKVRTMIVRPDGTLVPREEPAPAATEPTMPAAAGKQPSTAETIAASPAVVATATAPAAAKPDVIGQAAPAAEKNAIAGTVTQPPPQAAPSAQSAGATAQPEVAAATPAPAVQDAEPSLPARAPSLPSRPADQPVDIVGEVKPRTQVAAAAAAAASGGWSMQIASQPTPEGAQASYQDLARRYGSILDGRGVNIVKAEIAGKGTFWRVRVPVESRNEAIQLCNRYKAAGGSCFVSQ